MRSQDRVFEEGDSGDVDVGYEADDELEEEEEDPLYARDGSGYIVRRFVCKECRNSGHGRAYFYPIDPQNQYEQMPRYKVKYYRAHPDLRAEDEKAERTLMDSRIKEMLEKGFHEDMDEQDTDDEGVSGYKSLAHHITTQACYTFCKALYLSNLHHIHLLLLTNCQNFAPNQLYLNRTRKTQPKRTQMLSSTSPRC